MNITRIVAQILYVVLWATLLIQCTVPTPPRVTPHIPTGTVTVAVPVASTTPAATATSVPVPLELTAFYSANNDTQLVIQHATQQHVITIPTTIQQVIATDHTLAIRDVDLATSLFDLSTAITTTLPLACDDIAWHTAPDTLWCVAANNLYIVSPTHSTLAQIAPQGSQFVHVMPRPQTDELWGIQITTGRSALCRIVPATSCLMPADSATWHPDGQQIAVVNEKNVLVVKSDGTVQYTIPQANVHAVYWIDSNTMLLVTTYAAYQYTVDTQRTSPAPDWLVTTGLLGISTARVIPSTP